MDTEYQPRMVRRRTFWWVFVCAWCAYGLLYCSTALYEGAAAGRAILVAVAVVGSQATPALLVVWFRAFLFRERPLHKTVGVHLLTGVLYALAGAALVALTSSVLGLEPPEQIKGTPWLMALAQFVNGLFLYSVLLGFLMWTESLERIQEGRTMVAQAGRLRAEAEAKALRAQFSPHFIFNALHSMIQLIRADPDAAERSIEDMAGLIRYGSILQKRSSDTVPLAVEVAVAERYLALEHIRLGDRLRATLDVEDGMSDVAVPALTLQTLLENAVKHGIAPRPEGGSLGLSVHGDEGGIVITVQDDGCGADPAAVEADEESGLELLSRRLRNIYGPAAGTGRPPASLEWKTAPGAGFTATVRLPRQKAEGMDMLSHFRSRTPVG